MRVLVTGLTGFAGRHFLPVLLKKKISMIYGLEHSKKSTKLFKNERVRLFAGDVRSASQVEALIKKIVPDRIYHFAALSSTLSSWSAPAEFYETNVIGTLNILEAVRKLKLKTKIHLATSSEEYGKVYANELPIRETNLLRPLTPYGVSKVAQDLMGHQYFHNFGLPIVRTRAFIHIGPGQQDHLVASSFAKQIALIEKGRQGPVIRVGNLEAVRDFTDVRDVVRAYWLALEKGEPGEVYNISSGRGLKIKDILRVYLRKARIKIKIMQDPGRMRPSDAPILVGDSQKFFKKTGWKPEIALEKTLEDILDYWRERVSTRKP